MAERLARITVPGEYDEGLGMEGVALSLLAASRRQTWRFRAGRERTVPTTELGGGSAH